MPGGVVLLVSLLGQGPGLPPQSWCPVPASWLPGSQLVTQVSHGGLSYFPRPKCYCDLKAVLEAVPSLACSSPLLDCEVFLKLGADTEVGPHFCWLSLQPLWEPLTIVPYSPSTSPGTTAWLQAPAHYGLMPGNKTLNPLLFKGFKLVWDSNLGHTFKKRETTDVNS